MTQRSFLSIAIAWAAFATAGWLPDSILVAQPTRVTADQRQLAQVVQQQRIDAIEQVIGSVVAIYGLDRQGGGSGVIIDPTGIAVTNHHVIAGAGVRGLGGLDDGNLYPWKLIGTDPGGDVAVIQMTGRDVFPCAPLADSDQVQTGDWALAMGNPFLLAEDHVPTVTLGIVSGVNRYQPGAGANQLVYGNCIQVDSSINPGNSGGPLFNLAGEVIGINGRGSFQDRGRVNVGLGYAISSNQVKNFLPELLATKLTEHATLDAGFSDRQGKVVCSKLDPQSPIAKLGLGLKDELLEFEGVPIASANQFTNLICTLPEGWPASLRIRKPDGEERMLNVRAFGLPYPKRPRTKPLPPPAPPEDDPTEDDFFPELPSDPQQKKREENLKQEMIKLLSAKPGAIRDELINYEYASIFDERWLQRDGVEPCQADRASHGDQGTCLKVSGRVKRGGDSIGRQTMWFAFDGSGRLENDVNGTETTFVFEHQRYAERSAGDKDWRSLSLSETTKELAALQTLVLAEFLRPIWPSPDESGEGIRLATPAFARFGDLQLEGAGKSNGKLAWKMRAGDVRSGLLHGWFVIDSLRTGLKPQLAKVALDADGDAGAIRFEDWRDFGGGRLPYRMVYVKSLEEQEILQVEVDTVEWVAADSVNLKVEHGADE